MSTNSALSNLPIDQTVRHHLTRPILASTGFKYANISAFLQTVVERVDFQHKLHLSNIYDEKKLTIYKLSE